MKRDCCFLTPAENRSLVSVFIVAGIQECRKPMNSTFPRVRALLVSFFLLMAPAASRGQQLLHRYSFDDDGRDLVGGADGELMGDAAIADGAVVLSGNKPSYVNLPNDLFKTLTNVTFEIWVSWAG